MAQLIAVFLGTTAWVGGVLVIVVSWHRIVTDDPRLLNLLAQVSDPAMLAVPLPEADLLPMLADGMAIAALDGPRQCVVSGPTAGVEQLVQRLAGLGVDARRLRSAAAAHSVLVDDIVDEYADAVASVQLGPPRLAWISDRTAPSRPPRPAPGWSATSSRSGGRCRGATTSASTTTSSTSGARPSLSPPCTP